MPPGNRPKECHTKHLTEMERFRVRTLYFDAGMSKKRIAEVTKYSLSQIRTAIRAQSAAVRPRSGRPKKSLGGQPAPAPGVLVPASNSYPPTDPALASRASSAELSQDDQEHIPGGPPSFNTLPPEIRRYIWELVLTTPSPIPTPPSSSSSQPAPPAPPSPLSCTFWLERLPATPFAAAGVFPEHWAVQWRIYAHRRLSVTLLGSVNREARGIVQSTLSPVWCEAGGAPMLGSGVRIVWIDPRRDVVYCRGFAVEELGAVLVRARGALFPALGGEERAGGGGGGDDVNSRIHLLAAA
ncbi:hypothetical protein F5Y04DRAFT_80885 [Hypomontagnella monticulosa]|nr:hypothetical protein F5Y04DRAFT_80885 [Hypomontagnella monticulosa]